MKKILITILFTTFISLIIFSRTVHAASTFELTYPGQPGPLIIQTNWVPLQSVTKQITVKNLGTKTEKFALNLENLIGIPDSALAGILTAQVNRSGNILATNHLANLNLQETLIEEIPPGATYLYDIKVTMDDVGNEYQNKKTSFDLRFGWLAQVTGSVLGTSTEATPIGSLPTAGQSIGFLLITLAIIIFSAITYLLLTNKLKKTS